MKKLVFLLIICLNIQTLIAQKSVAVYWDASYSMKDRNIDKELKFLGDYFKKNTNSIVILKMFSNDILLKENYAVENGDWSNLKKELLQTVYDGATSYAGLFNDKVDEYLLFTDGNENMDRLNPPTIKPIHIISSIDNTNTTDLKLISDLSSGRFVFLNTDFGTNQTLERKEEIISEDFKGLITGNVKGFEGMLPNVSIINQNSGIGSASDARGTYRIKADKGDVLVFSFLGKKTISVRVDRADIINITMANINENLDEVVVTAEAEKEELVNTGNNSVDKKRLGYSVETITNDDISELDMDITDATAGQFTNFEITNDSYSKTDISKFLGRGKNMSILLNQYGIIVVDGMPLGQSDSGFGGISYRQDDIINPDMIASITYLKGLAATNKYGTLGRNGVLLITTKNAVQGKSNIAKEAKPLGTTATYSGNAESMSELPDEPYINVLKTSKTVEEAFNNYLQQRKNFGDDPVFYIDAFDYFKDWNNPLLSNRILSNVYELAYDNAYVLKALAYKQQASGYFEDALLTYKRISRLEPKQSQSYRDLALANVFAKKYEDALKLYDNIDKNRGVGNINLSGIKKTFTNEAKNLLAFHANKLNTVGVNQKFMKPTKYKSRIVFEWNDLDAEFDLNVVNPQNRLYTWSHTQAENSQRIFQQHDQGYGLEEFYLTSSDQGEWKFNIKYYGKTSKDLTPTFIKITTYKNYGYPNQSKSIEVIRLDKKDVEQTVSKLVVN